MSKHLVPIPELLERFDKVVLHLDTPCWLWKGALCFGYAILKRKGKTMRGSRFFYETLVGPIPDGLSLDHLCNPKNGDKLHRRCCNPAHLEPVTSLVNSRRGLGGAFNRDKTECPQGHPYTRDNTYLTISRRRRRCRICTLDSNHRTRHRSNSARNPNRTPSMSHLKKPILRDGLVLWVCAKCRQAKVEEEFHKCRGTANGLYHYCKICQRAISNLFYRKKKRRLAKMQRELAALKARQ